MDAVVTKLLFCGATKHANTLKCEGPGVGFGGGSDGGCKNWHVSTLPGGKFEQQEKRNSDSQSIGIWE